MIHGSDGYQGQLSAKIEELEALNQELKDDIMQLKHDLMRERLPQVRPEEERLAEMWRELKAENDRLREALEAAREVVEHARRLAGADVWPRQWKLINEALTTPTPQEVFDPDNWVCRDCEAGEPHTCQRYGKLKNQERHTPQEATIESMADFIDPDWRETGFNPHADTE